MIRVARLSRLAVVVLAALGLCARGARASDGVVLPPRSLASALALPVPGTDGTDSHESVAAADGALAGFMSHEPPNGSQRFLFGRKSKPQQAKPAKPEHVRPPVVLSPERAAVLLRSLTVPGWGQLSTGHRTAATVFGLAEAGVWTTYTAFRIQSQLRHDAYFRTAKVLAGIDLKGRDEEFLRIVGAFASSEEYNQLVVARDAANLYYNDPAAFQAYLNEHSLRGADTWVWPNEEAFLRYRGQRKDSQRAALRANAALAMAVVNRLFSAIHAARLRPTTAAHTWEMQTQPVDGDPTAFRVGVLRRF